MEGDQCTSGLFVVKCTSYHRIYCECMMQVHLEKAMHTEMLTDPRNEKIRRYNNYPSCVMVQWWAGQISLLNFLGWFWVLFTAKIPSLHGQKANKTVPTDQANKTVPTDQQGHFGWIKKRFNRYVQTMGNKLKTVFNFITWFIRILEHFFQLKLCIIHLKVFMLMFKRSRSFNLKSSTIIKLSCFNPLYINSLSFK